MRYASGDYIAFVDADDWLKLDMYKILYNKMCEGNYDVVSGKFIREHFKGEKISNKNEGKDIIYNLKKREGLYYGIVTECGKYGEYGSLCTGLYKRELFYENEIWFPERLAYEDNFFESILKLYVGRLCIIDKVLYHYFINPNSTVTKRDAKYQLDRLEIEMMKVEEFKRRGAFEIYHDEIEWDFLKYYYLNTWFIIFKRFSYVPDIYSEMKQAIIEVFPKFYDEYSRANYIRCPVKWKSYFLYCFLLFNVA